ncbi:MAG: hypothetical protein D6793_03445 [Thermoflexia bacterium]|nr:MAG: hypothetical protein D6793_03445 [Thermoflexia bacterium]
MELVEGPETGVPATERAVALVEMAMERSVIFDLDTPDVVHGLPARRNGVKIKPPLTIAEEQLDRALDVFEAVLEEAVCLPASALEYIRQKMIESAMPG